jgi:TonB family protein
LERQLELLSEDDEPGGGISTAILFSLILHVIIVIWVVLNYHPVVASAPAPEVAHYIELIRQQPDAKQFTEAPGAKTATAPMTAPFSDANRKASSPRATGPNPTLRPGDDSQIYAPPSGGSPTPPQQAVPQQQAQRPSQQQPQDQQQQDESPEAAQAAKALARQSPTFQYHPASAAVDWKAAIQQAGKVASLGGGQDGPELGQMGGDKGFTADNGPLSFETQWYDWGEYAQSMVSRIRVNWYANMPQLIRMGVKGVVTIRFTIHRDGHLTDITILNGSTVPPYDFAAKKAIELSSPLNALPKDFPEESERVTCQFYYNMEVPGHPRQ